MKIEHVGLQLNGYDRSRIGLVNERALDFYNGKIDMSRRSIAKSNPSFQSFSQVRHHGNISSPSSLYDKVSPVPPVAARASFIPNIVSMPSQSQNIVQFNNTGTGLHVNVSQSSRSMDARMAQILNNVQKRIATTNKRSLIEIHEISDEEEAPSKKHHARSMKEVITIDDDDLALSELPLRKKMSKYNSTDDDHSIMRVFSKNLQ